MPDGDYSSAIVQNIPRNTKVSKVGLPRMPAVKSEMQPADLAGQEEEAITHD
jgi:hypothetical protein